MTLVPRRFCSVCGHLLLDDRCVDHGENAEPCPATNKAGDVCIWPAGHVYPHRRADGQDFGAEQPDSELAAIIRGAFTAHENQDPYCTVELEAIESAELESAEVYGVKGPGVVVLKVTFRSKRKVAR
jgi:hypothetical protein